MENTPESQEIYVNRMQDFETAFYRELNELEKDPWYTQDPHGIAAFKTFEQIFCRLWDTFQHIARRGDEAVSTLERMRHEGRTIAEGKGKNLSEAVDRMISNLENAKPLPGPMREVPEARLSEVRGVGPSVVNIASVTNFYAAGG